MVASSVASRMEELGPGESSISSSSTSLLSMPAAMTNSSFSRNLSRSSSNSAQPTHLNRADSLSAKYPDADAKTLGNLRRFSALIGGRVGVDGELPPVYGDTNGEVNSERA